MKTFPIILATASAIALSTGTANASYGNSQNTNIGGSTNIGSPKAAAAPLPTGGAPGQIGDIVVPLPSIGIGAFSTQDDYDYGYGSSRNTSGVTLGFHIPLGTGAFREAAENEVARRANADEFRTIQEAVYLRDNGLLTQERFPRHYAALNGTTETVFKF